MARRKAKFKTKSVLFRTRERNGSHARQSRRRRHTRLDQPWKMKDLGGEALGFAGRGHEDQRQKGRLGGDVVPLGQKHQAPLGPVDPPADHEPRAGPAPGS